MVWACDKAPGALVFQPDGTLPWPTSGVLYVAISYVDRGYGKIDVQVIRGGKATGPDRYLGLARMDTGKVVTARMRIPAGGPSLTGGISVRVGLERAAQAQPLWIQGVEIDNQPFADPHFDYVITDPWAGPYTGPTVKPADNTTLKGKVMVGYQGWFRTPNDPDGRGWVHWGDIQHGHFSTDMWPDVSQYPADVLEKAADVHTLSGRQGYLFSSDWPEVTDLHFRWMREYHIDGAFLQRFGRTFESTPKGPDWVLANVRAAANREGRIWAIEYDVSGCPDGKLLEAISSDWEWLVDTFGLLKDPNYARDSGKPVVFIWGMPVAGRNITVATANQVVDFFKNDPKYGGNYVIGGIPGNWQKLDASWQDHFKRYDSVLPWMSQDYAGDLAGFRKMGVTYFPHVKPGFSWANLKHIATGDMMSYNPRQGGLYYWNLLSKAARAGVDRLFVGMFDEYDESTAIIPMSDDPPPTPAEPGVGATFYNGPRAEERGLFVRLADTAIPLGTEQPAKGISPQNFFVRMGGQILLPQPGSYMLSVQGAPGDDARLTVGGIKLIDVKNLQEVASAKTPVIISARSEVSFQLDYRHGIGAGEVRLLWANLGGPSAPVPAAALRDAWGRFLTNDGRPSDWWLKLTALGKEMINGTLSPNTPMPLPGWAPAR
ncbi:MAG TPA: PA14 domain-containing protein [Chthoniobacteraceae bacterium]|nr:PA14 domain-containing protein [Chthoniobacteraceae bacterium]